MAGDFWASTFGNGNSFKESVANTFTPGDGQRYESGTLRDETAAEKASLAKRTAAAKAATAGANKSSDDTKKKVNTVYVNTEDGAGLELTQEQIQNVIAGGDYTDIDDVLAAAVDSTVAERKAYNDRIDGILDFDTWSKDQDGDYLTQYTAYKDYANKELRDRPEWMTSDDKDYGRKSFADFNPGIILVANTNERAKMGAGDEIVGYYRSEDAADAKYADIMDTKLKGFGYDHLITDNMGFEDYKNAYETYNNSKGFIDQISALGYGDLVDKKTSFSDLEKMYGEVKERDRYKNLLDDMGYEYDANDNATGLGLMYGQAQAIEDVKGKLADAKGQYSGLESTYNKALTDMEGTQGQFDDLFSDYGSLTTDYGDLQGTYDDLSTRYGTLEGTYNTTKEDLGKKAGEYDTLSGLYDTLTSNYGTVSDDYNAAIGSLGDLQGNYDTLSKDKTALQSTYDELFGDYGSMTADKDALQGDYNALTGDYDAAISSLGKLNTDYGSLSDDFSALTNTQAMTLDDLATARDEAAGVRGDLRANETSQFLSANERDRTRRIGSGIGQVQAPTQPQYTQAMDALGSTALDPGSYQMAPIDFTSGLSDAGVFDPMALSDPAAYGATDYTNLAAPNQMGLPQTAMDFGQPFNPYFEALNQQYGVNFPASNYGMPAIKGS